MKFNLYGSLRPSTLERQKRIIEHTKQNRMLKSLGLNPSDFPPRKICSDIKPISTVYNGYKFRSRLEARWAVFFDAAGIEYQYEPEGFVLADGSYYLPDFYLPWFNAYVEIKPSSITTEYERDTREKLMSLVNSTDRDLVVMLFIGDPMNNNMSVYCGYEYYDLDEDGTNWFFGSFYKGCLFRDIPPDGDNGAYYRYPDDYITFNCAPIDGVAVYFKGKCIENADRCVDYKSDFTFAKLKARQARFEHGEKQV